MKLDLDHALSTPPHLPARAPVASVSSETDLLTDVLLCPPAHLKAVPCCSATKASLRNGFAVCRETAQLQHAALKAMLQSQGVICHTVAPAPDMPDLCFTRDVAATTPWGVVALNPALPHRRREVDRAIETLARLGMAPGRRIAAGTLEGGDVCVARPGLLIVGFSGERSSREGAAEFAEPFERAGWDVILYPFDPHFLHLDTIFCMVGPDKALACTDVLDDWFLKALRSHGIALLPVPYKSARSLGCNVVSLDGRRILTSADHPEVAASLWAAGFEPLGLDISQFAACGGGIHCLTLPLRRVAA